MSDIKLVESKDGGDFEMIGPDIVIIEGFQNMPYLASFGGNVKSNTKEFEEGEQRFDWWGNALLMEADSSIQFNSDLERLLLNVALTSESRLEIEQIVKNDLKFMNEFSSVDVDVFIVLVDRIQIDVKITELSNLESTIFTYIWDSTKMELINKSS